MDVQQAREQLLAEFKRHGLPSSYIQRLLDEFDDHLEDLQDERSSDMARKPQDAATESQTPSVINLYDRLGNPVELAAFAAKQYHNRSFLGRHPIFTFLVMPLPVVVISFIVAAFLFLYIGSDLTGFLDSMNEAAHPLLSNLVMSLVVWSLTILPPLMTMLLLCRIARRNAVRWQWVITPCILGAIYCAQLRIISHAKPSPTGKGFLGCGWGIYLDSWHWTVYHFLPRFTLALTIGLLLIKRAQRLLKLDQALTNPPSSVAPLDTTKPRRIEGFTQTTTV